MQPLNVSIKFYILLCDRTSSPNYYWQILIFVYLALLQVIGIVLAFQTRRIKFKGLRDSKFIAAIIYISSIVLVVLALVTFTLRVYINVSGGIYAGGVLILTTMFLSLIFIPKVGPRHESIRMLPISFLLSLLSLSLFLSPPISLTRPCNNLPFLSRW